MGRYLEPKLNTEETILKKLTALRVLPVAVATVLLAACATPSAPRIVQTPGCMSDAQVDAMFAAYQARKPAANPAEMTDADAACARAKFQQRLAGKYGPLIGYKAGLTNPAVQKRFAYDKPVWGALYTDMMLPSGAVVDAGFGARPLFEADLLVRVKSTAINSARTPADVMANIDQVIPFIELPDLMVETPAPPKFTGVGISAINVGARLGVRGTPIAVPADAAGQARMLGQLRDMNVRLVDGTGAELGKGKGSDVLGHPLNAVVWLAEALRAQGLAMQPGQVISLGSFSPLVPAKAGVKGTVHYDGLAGAQPVTVSFT